MGLAEDVKLNSPGRHPFILFDCVYFILVIFMFFIDLFFFFFFSFNGVSIDLNLDRSSFVSIDRDAIDRFLDGSIDIGPVGHVTGFKISILFIWPHFSQTPESSLLEPLGLFFPTSSFSRSYITLFIFLYITLVFSFLFQVKCSYQ